ncbi:MAG: sigma-54 dependent transcriptional regulator [Xanthomonadaceae bacterium]|nr:sigma-54 dependent transcriptional regulator [Xanthomonadaceae bacterium]
MKSASPEPRPSLSASEPPKLIGESMAMRALRKTIQKAAATTAPVLITGETGTGKELVAHLLHQQSGRAHGPFVAVNCAALPASLFQAEVFGYEKGAFTGAYRRNAGRIEAAEGGTLFLDEIGDLALDMQVILLRFLEEGTFERLGSVDTIHADVRIVAATHIDLEQACRTGRFREDLFYRLNALHVQTPPLRDRGEDIEHLAVHFLAELGEELGLRAHQLAPDALARIRQHAWPGNIRELRNRVRQALVMCESEMLTVADLDLESTRATNPPPDAPLTLRQARHQAERQAIERALLACGGKIPATARCLGVSRAQLYRLLERHRMSYDYPVLDRRKAPMPRKDRRGGG